MKKILFLLMICAGFNACTLNTEEETENEYVLTAEDREIFGTILESELQSLNWTYSPEEIKFGAGFFPYEEDANYEKLREVSEKMGYDTKNWVGGERTATAAVPIYHPNGDWGGDARFYFKNNLIICGYYTYNDVVYSMGDEAVFKDNSVLTVFENTEIENIDFTETEITLDFDNFSDISPKSGMTAVIEDNRLNFYTLRTGAFELTKSYSEDDFGYIPFDAAFDNDGKCAVLVGDIDENGNKKSRKIIILDSLLNPTDSGFDLYDTGFIQILYEDGVIILGSSSTVSLFNGETRDNTENYKLIHYIKGMSSCDIYGNGTRVYAITDGTNIFVYSGNFTLLWRSYYNDDEITDNYIYFGDMNEDGVKEIFTTSLTSQTTIKYILTETGFSKADDTDATAIYLPGDFDCNNRFEYIFTDPTGTKILNYVRVSMIGYT
ncbi:MAG: hypothetical protein LUD77_10805 [Clostridiales bacterium]|nr:hypothetical protein [Clostridiales bacterium]